MKLIASTPDGFIAEVSRTEAAQMSNTPRPAVGDVLDPVMIIRRSEWIRRHIDALLQLETDLEQARERIGNLRQLQKEESNG